MDLNKAYERVQGFKQGILKERISALEQDLRGADKAALASLYSEQKLHPDLLGFALELKRAASQIDTVVHAVGILLSLPYILREAETVQSLSLGAGNTGRLFDLETDARIAQFKFIDWKGGAETVRQNQLFKDFFSLAEYPTPKDKFLYVLGTERPLSFLSGGRALRSVMSRDASVWERFRGLYGERFSSVAEYYEHRRDSVKLVNLADVVPGLAGGDM